jgi:hypothetical protein
MPFALTTVYRQSHAFPSRAFDHGEDCIGFAVQSSYHVHQKPPVQEDGTKCH